VKYLLDTNVCIKYLTQRSANDLLIAATALANGLTLVTHNLTEFGRVRGLALEDWEAEP
jgi:predicted nucleic acid-binding protein